jgi:ELWxxDGT repeat protein
MNLTNIGDVLYFAAFDVAHGWQLWRVGSASAGPEVLTAFTNAQAAVPSYLTPVGRNVFFTRNLTELWAYVRRRSSAPTREAQQHLSLARIRLAEKD